MLLKRIIISVLILAAVGGGVWFWWQSKAQAAKPAPPASTAKVEKGGLRATVRSTGKVVSNLDVEIKCKASGEIVKLPFDVSDAVKTGDLLVELDPVDVQRSVDKAKATLAASAAKLASAKENLSIAEQNLKTARQRAEAMLKSAVAKERDAKSRSARMVELLAKKLASQEDADSAMTSAEQAGADLLTAKAAIDDLRAQELTLELRKQDIKLAEAQVDSDRIALSIQEQTLKDTKVVAPIDGVVSARGVQIGQIISSGITNVGGGTSVMTLSDLSRIFTSASVDESDIGRVRLDQPVDITADAFPGVKFPGKVVRIATRGVNTSNVVTFEVKIEITGEKKNLLKPEMTTNVEIVLSDVKDALLAPVDAVFRKSGKQWVSLVKADGIATEDREVKVGITDGVKYQVIEGLAEGDTVVTRSDAASKWRAAGGNRPPTGPMMMGAPGGGRR